MPHPADLPFVTFTNKTFNPWSVTPSGDWARDCATGRAYAEALIEHVRAEDDGALFAQVLLAIGAHVAVNAKTGLETGFLASIAAAACRCACPRDAETAIGQLEAV